MFSGAMVPTPPKLQFSTDFDPHAGEAVHIAPGLVRVTARNSGPFTFSGTNSFIMGDREVAVVDPGPDDPSHLEALLAVIAGRHVVAIIITHTHKDHCGLARSLAERTGAPLWFGGAHRLSRPLRPFEINIFKRAGDWTLKPDRTLVDGDELKIDQMVLSAVALPGHCANHFGLAIKGTDYVLTGDHVMGWNSTLVATPDGSLSDYFASLDRLMALPQNHYLPAHGGPIPDGRTYAAALRAHRMMRNGQILEALAAGPMSLARLTGKIYPMLTGRLAIAARRTLLSHVEYLEARGDITTTRRPWGLRVARGGIAQAGHV
jgi:glyoxylase-like metal-dependent hydrolase (beta-lactamase superfamily II)